MMDNTVPTVPPAALTSIETTVHNIITACNFRAPSLIITVLGDSIAPHGGTFWMGSLIELMAPMGVNERLVRTATFRLTKENWLTSQQIGRRSYYSLTKASVKSFEEAFRRVYNIPDKPWNGEWCLMFMNGNDMAQGMRDRIRTELSWLGFGSIAPTVFAHPTVSSAIAREKLQHLKADDKIVIMHARVDQISNDTAISDFICRCWDIDKLGDDYTRFLSLFRPLWRLLKEKPGLSPELCFLIRTILIHEFRRLTLRDPQLPAELLSPDWPGAAARVLCRNIYRLVQASAERHLLSLVETVDGPLPNAEPQYFTRFGRLD